MEMNNNEQHTLDIAVRQALENLEIPYNANHWELMDGKLDALDAQDADFDKNFASKLADVQVPYVAANWSLMDSKLDALDAQDGAFDTHFADKLANIEAPYVAANWSDMNDRLDELDNTDSSFDDLLRQRLGNIQPNMPQNHWALMENKIEEAFSWRRKIVRYKVVEVALVLLTLFTVVNTLDLPFDSVRSTDAEIKTMQQEQKGGIKPTTPTKTPETKSFYNPTDWRNRPATPNNNVQPNQPNTKPIVAVDNAHNGVTSNPIAVQSSNNLETKTQTGSPISAANSGNKNTQSESYNNTPNQDGQTGAPITVAMSEVETKNALLFSRNTEGGNVTELPTRQIPTIGKVTDGSAVNQAIASVGNTELEAVDILKPSLLNTRVYDENIILPKGKEKRAKWRVNVFGSPSVDLVTVNSIQNREWVIDTQKTPNIAAGVAFGYKKGRVEIETGLTYLDKKYDLPNVEATGGSFLRGYNTEKPQNLRLSIVSIPLSINYTAKATRRLGFYARIGTALNTILKSEVSQFATTDGAANKSAKAGYDVLELNVYPKGVTEKGFFKDGNWLRGGLKENTYVTAHAGLGVEYRLTSKTDIYLQPGVDYNFSKRGLGVFNDRIHSLSIQGGVKTKLK
jgi:hypothetical protein